MNKYQSYLRNLFSNKKIYLLGGEIKELIVNEFKCSDSYARKIINLAVKGGIIQTNKEFTFGKGQYIYWGNGYKISEDIIKEKFKDTRHNVYRVLNRFENNNGVISYFEIYKLSACTTEKTNSKITKFEDIIRIVNSIKEIEIVEDQGVKYLIQADSQNRNIDYMKNYYSRMKIECTFIPIILRWLQKSNIVDNEDVLYRNKNIPCNGVVINKLVWDACAFTGTVGFNEEIVNKGKNKKSFVPIDISISEEYTYDDLKGFYDRLQIFRNSVIHKKRKIVPIIFAANISDNTKRIIKNLNILCFDMKVIFGQKVIDVLDNLKIISLQNIYGQDYSNYNDVTVRIRESLKTIVNTGQEENLYNLKGDFFEALMYKVFSMIFRGSIIRKNYILNYTENDKRYTYEYDYIIETEDEKIICELKGYRKDSIIKLGNYIECENKPEPNTIKWFFSYTLNKARKRLSDSDRKIKACYITTAQIESKAIEKIEKMSKLKSDKIDIYYNRNKLIDLLKSKKCYQEVDLIEQYY